LNQMPTSALIFEYLDSSLNADTCLLSSSCDNARVLLVLARSRCFRLWYDEFAAAARDSSSANTAPRFTLPVLLASIIPFSVVNAPRCACHTISPSGFWPRHELSHSIAAEHPGGSYFLIRLDCALTRDPDDPRRIFR
jgi:hypothetical protein